MKIVTIMIRIWKGTVLHLLQSADCSVNCLQHACLHGHGVQIMCNIGALAMCHMSCATQCEDSSAIEFDRVESHLLIVVGGFFVRVGNIQIYEMMCFSQVGRLTLALNFLLSLVTSW